MSSLHLIGIVTLSILLVLQGASAKSSSSSSSSSSSRLLGTTSSTSSLTPPRHPAFYPPRRRWRAFDTGSSSTTSATTPIILSHRKHGAKIIQTAKLSKSSSSSSSSSSSRRRWSSSSASATDFESEYNDQNDSYFHPRYSTSTSTMQQQQQQQQHREPTLEELRSQLSPLSLLISNSIELTVVTLGSYLSGGLLGYFGGGIMGIPSTLLGKDMGTFLSRLGALHAKAIVSCKSWATLSASFTGFNNLVRLCRGDEHNDNWNAVLGSAMTGAFLNRKGGAQAMIQGGATYAAFTYFLDKFFGSSPRQQQQKQLSSELLYTDIDIDD